MTCIGEAFEGGKKKKGMEKSLHKPVRVHL